MGINVNRSGGPAFNQDETPNPTPAGSTWWQRKGNVMSGCNGVVWGGQYGFGESGAGYYLGWTSGGASRAINRILFSTETFADLATSLPADSYGGFTSDTSGYSWTWGLDLTKMTFATETTSLISNGITTAQENEPGMCQSSSKGYVSCGQNNSFGYSTHSSAFDMVTETGGTIGGYMMAYGRSRKGYQSNNNGYFVGRAFAIGTDIFDWIMSTRIDRITFTTEAFSTTTAGLTGEGRYASSNTQTGSTGYSVGGISPYGGWHDFSQLDKMSFSTEASSAVSSSTSMQGYCDSNPATTTICYMGGQYSVSGGWSSVIDTLSFANETVANYAQSLPTVTNGYGSYDSSN